VELSHRHRKRDRRREGCDLGPGAFFQHEDGSTQPLFYYGLNIGPAQTCVFDHDRPAPSLVVLIETVCSSWRVGNRGIIEASVMASENASQSLRAVIVDIRSP
jgi:hypothetical protein